MSRSHDLQRKTSAAAIALALCAGWVWAAGPEIKIQLQGSYKPADRTQVKWAALQGDSKVAPGDRLLYNLEIANQGDREARNPVAFGPIPAGTAFVAGTATQGHNIKVDYSIDGGKTYSASPTFTTLGKDGKPQTVPAPVGRYTTVRWMWNSVLPAGEQARVSYQVQVR